jgi:hypothetical protein
MLDKVKDEKLSRLCIMCKIKKIIKDMVTNFFTTILSCVRYKKILNMMQEHHQQSASGRQLSALARILK